MRLLLLRCDRLIEQASNKEDKSKENEASLERLISVRTEVHQILSSNPVSDIHSASENGGVLLA